MEMSYHKIDLAACEARQQKPVDIIQRGHANEIWHVPFSPVDFVNEADWRFYRREDNVVIPLFPYLTPNDPVDAFGFACQLGIRIIHELGGRQVRRLHLSLGMPAQQVYDQHTGQTHWSFMLGVGVVLLS